jgi:hypothetical protein
VLGDMLAQLHDADETAAVGTSDATTVVADAEVAGEAGVVAEAAVVDDAGVGEKPSVDDAGEAVASSFVSVV